MCVSGQMWTVQWVKVVGHGSPTQLQSQAPVCEHIYCALCASVYTCGLVSGLKFWGMGASHSFRHKPLCVNEHVHVLCALCAYLLEHVWAG